MSFHLTSKIYTTPRWALGDENVIGISSFKGYPCLGILAVMLSQWIKINVDSGLSEDCPNVSYKRCHFAAATVWDKHDKLQCCTVWHHNKKVWIQHRLDCSSYTSPDPTGKAYKICEYPFKNLIGPQILARKFWPADIGPQILARKYWPANFGPQKLARRYWPAKMLPAARKIAPPRLATLLVWIHF